MRSLSEKLLARKIVLHGSAAAGSSHKVLCPECSHTRRNKKDPCLSLTIDRDGDNAIWNCHNCGWAGTTKWDDQPERRPRRGPPVRPKDTIERPTVEVMQWFAERQISAEVVRRNKVGFVRKHYIAQLEREVPCIAFPYYRDGELINVKYRALEAKAFAQAKGAESIFYGVDDIADIGDGKVIIVEGEPDKLALEECGYLNVISVPDGAPPKLREDPRDDDPKFEYLRNCAEQLEAVKGGFILAVDSDAKGRILEEELARRLGKERCWRVRWPDSVDVPVKDANECLWEHGREIVRECIEAAEPYPISGLYTWNDYEDELRALYAEGRKRGASTGWARLDESMTIAPGQLSIVTGIPNHGKSEFVDALVMNLAQRSGWCFALCSFENEPEEHIAKLAEKRIGAPFWDGPTRRMTPAELDAALAWGREHFVFIRADDDTPPTIDWILERGRAAVLRHGVRGLVIDPYNEIEHRRPANMTETEYVSQILGKVKRFAQNHGVHVWFVAHPMKLPRENGKVPVPTLYDISGSANWANKADIGFAVYRNDQAELVEIYVQKVRHKWVGKIGRIELVYDKVTGRYSEPVQSPAGAARAYRED